MVGRQLLSRQSPTRLHRRARRQSFETVLMVRTSSRVGIFREVVWDAYVTHLRVQHAMNELAIYHGSAADARAHGEINEIRDPAPRSPTGFAGCGRVDVRIESNGDFQGAVQTPSQVALLPFDLGSRSDISERRRFGA